VVNYGLVIRGDAIVDGMPSQQVTGGAEAHGDCRRVVCKRLSVGQPDVAAAGAAT
jgi:hypothetical protein